MKSFTLAFKEYLYWQTIDSTYPKLVYINGKYEVTLFYSEHAVLRMGAELIHG
jgi:hypothetical protein